MTIGVALAAVLAFMAAGFLILARLVGLGFMADFLSRTVLIGFLTGVGIQVALGEISGMLGLKGGGHGTLQKIWNDIQQIDQVNLYALGTALAVMGWVRTTPASRSNWVFRGWPTGCIVMAISA